MSSITVGKCGKAGINAMSHGKRSRIGDCFSLALFHLLNYFCTTKLIRITEHNIRGKEWVCVGGKHTVNEEGTRMMQNMSLYSNEKECHLCPFWGWECPVFMYKKDSFKNEVAWHETNYCRDAYFSMAFSCGLFLISQGIGYSMRWISYVGKAYLSSQGHRF